MVEFWDENGLWKIMDIPEPLCPYINIPSVSAPAKFVDEDTVFAKSRNGSWIDESNPPIFSARRFKLTYIAGPRYMEILS